MYNEMREIQGCRSWRKWQRAQMRKSYAENLKVQFMQTGKCRTHYLSFEYSTTSGRVRVSSAENSILLPIAEFLENMMELFMAEMPDTMPLLEPEVARKTVVRNAHTLPDYGQKPKTRAEEYAERLRRDRWDVRRNGDPCDWRRTRV